MQLPVVFLAVLAASWVQGGEANKCNHTYIALIRAFNEKVPTNILATNFERSPDCAAYTTEGYFPNEKTISGVVTSWTKKGEYTSQFIYKNKATLATTVRGGPLIEYNGVTYDNATMIHRWHILTTGLVDAFYKCQEEGKEGPPEALIKVWKGFKEADLKKAKENVEMLLGCKLSVKYDTV